MEQTFAVSLSQLMAANTDHQTIAFGYGTDSASSSLWITTRLSLSNQLFVNVLAVEPELAKSRCEYVGEDVIDGHVQPCLSRATVVDRCLGAKSSQCRTTRSRSSLDGRHWKQAPLPY